MTENLGHLLKRAREAKVKATSNRIPYAIPNGIEPNVAEWYEIIESFADMEPMIRERRGRGGHSCVSCGAGSVHHSDCAWRRAREITGQSEKQRQAKAEAIRKDIEKLQTEMLKKEAELTKLDL